MRPVKTMTGKALLAGMYGGDPYYIANMVSNIEREAAELAFKLAIKDRGTYWFDGNQDDTILEAWKKAFDD